ncbi:MAG: dihydrodipicolinate synthase family protein, partial [Candidatus Limnocylindrales bacterium]
MSPVHLPSLDPSVGQALAGGVVIPAHPLALTAGRRLDERRQRALTRYYLASGAGGVAVAVHTTQFAIREPSVGLLRPVLE